MSLQPNTTQAYQRVSTIQDPPSSSSELSEKNVTNVVRLRSDRGRVGWIILLPTALLMLASAGLATFLILWLTVIRGIPGSEGLSASIASSRAFTVNEGTTDSPDGEAQARLLGLTISTITVNFLCPISPRLRFPHLCCRHQLSPSALLS
jgi:hypothetical protein